MRLDSRYGYVCSTYPGSASRRCGCALAAISSRPSVSEPLELGLVVRPAALDAHPHFEKHRTAEQPLHVDASRARDLLHPHAALAEQDRPLVRTLDVNGRVNAPHPVAFLERVDRDRRRVRNFFAEQPKDLFANELGGE